MLTLIARPAVGAAGLAAQIHASMLRARVLGDRARTAHFKAAPRRTYWGNTGVTFSPAICCAILRKITAAMTFEIVSESDARGDDNHRH